MEFAVMIGLAVVELLVGYAISDTQAKEAEARSAHETRVRALFGAVRDRFGLAYNQLDQLLSNLDIRLSQLTDATRGSARLSKASQILRQYVNSYPGARNKINNAKSAITNSMNNLTSMENNRASQIQRRQEVSDLDVLEDVVPEISTINTTLTDVNGGSNNNPNSNGDMHIEITDKDKQDLTGKTNASSSNSSGKGYPTVRVPIPGTV